MLKSSKIIIVYLMVSLLCINCKQEAGTEVHQEIKSDTIQTDPLPSWNDTAAKKDIMAYVNAATDENNSNFIPVKDRIATFDNDGTLWSEQPAYFQLYFAIDRIKSMAADHPEWQNKQPFKAVLDNDMEALNASGMHGLLTLVMTSHAGLSATQFQTIVNDWIKTAKHPTKDVSYDKLVYQPMLELLQYLRAHQFKTYIVSGGGVDFMRAIVTEVYGIPAEQIIGSRVKTSWDYNNGNPVINRLPELDFNNDKEGKAINIHHIIGKKPVFAAGNSDGDLQMLQYTASNPHKSFMLYIHHTDEQREWAYDRESHIGKLDKGLDQAIKDGWTVSDMKNDWKVIYPFEMN
ncbi:MAG: haloacid dehalogenase-like hydrolase [Flavobacteriaceae bacterium]|nr:haloacid dehalogenase-like hydrolase [Flavobacteriaceae bacterium]